MGQDERDKELQRRQDEKAVLAERYAKKLQRRQECKANLDNLRKDDKQKAKPLKSFQEEENLIKEYSLQRENNLKQREAEKLVMDKAFRGIGEKIKTQEDLLLKLQEQINHAEREFIDSLTMEALIVG